MKLILHIGMPKAGSTALQRGLCAAAPQLRDHRILYPAGGRLPKNHNMLVCGLFKGPNLPRLFRHVYVGDDSRRKRDFAAFLQAIETEVQNSRPGTLVLSGEMLFVVRSPKNARKLKEILGRFSDEVTIVAYVRSPAQYYLSRAQQVLKASSRISPPRPIRYRRVIESYLSVSKDILAISYERSRLHGGDITRDFLHRFAPDLLDPLGAEAVREANQTLSAEGMDILHRYRGLITGQDGVFTTDTGALIRAIGAAEDAVGGFRRPQIRDQVLDYVNGASIDVLWLREHFDIVFSDVDYDRVSDAHTKPPAPASVPEICLVDDARRDRMLMTVLNGLDAGSDCPGIVDKEGRRQVLATIRERLTVQAKHKEMRFKAALGRRKRRLPVET